MRKWFFLFLTIIILALLAFFFLLSSITNVHREISVNANENAISRVILNDRLLKKWWPGQVANSKELMFDGYKFQLTDKRLTALIFSITKDDFSADALLNFIPTTTDTTKLSWDVQISSGGFGQRISNLFSRNNSFKNDLDSILSGMKNFFSNQVNLYGYKIDEVQVVDSILVSTFTPTKNYPATSDVYSLINGLKNYINKNGAQITGYPMLNVTTTDSVSYLVKVALPVNKMLPNSGNITNRRMMGRGNIFVMEVHGGQSSINDGFKNLENYIHDYNRTPVAIPFQSLITDRSKEPDTSKWVTKIYYPII